ncbi:hypothetical protein D3C80_1554230 [compost metagenome]
MAVRNHPVVYTLLVLFRQICAFNPYINNFNPVIITGKGGNDVFGDLIVNIAPSGVFTDNIFVIDLRQLPAHRVIDCFVNTLNSAAYRLYGSQELRGVGNSPDGIIINHNWLLILGQNARWRAFVRHLIFRKC